MGSRRRRQVPRDRLSEGLLLPGPKSGATELAAGSQNYPLGASGELGVPEGVIGPGIDPIRCVREDWLSGYHDDIG